MASASIYDILTIQWVKDAFLPGIDLRDDNGTTFPQEMFDSALHQAVADTEQELDIKIEPVVIVNERHDMTDRDRNAFYPMYLWKKPFVSMQRVEVKYGDMDLFTFPNSWATLQDERLSYFHIIAQTDNVSSVQQVLLPGLGRLRGDYMPGWFAFDYTAGFRVYTGTAVFAIGATSVDVVFAPGETFQNSDYYGAFLLVNPNVADANILPFMVTKTATGMTIRLDKAPVAQLTVKWFVTNIPDNLRSLIGIRAAKKPLAIAGNFVMGSGVQSVSLGVDGLSQSRSTSKGPRGAFGGILATLEIQEIQTLKSLKSQWKNVSTFSI